MNAIDLREAAQSLSSANAKVRMEGMRQIITLHSLGHDCGSVISRIGALDNDARVSMHRFANILNKEYARDALSLENAIKMTLRDYDDSSPLIKSLAVRQAGNLVTPETADRLIPLIVRSSYCEDPYVRKAAALAVLRIHHRDPTLLQRYELITVLTNLVEDSNPNVAANSLCAILEINSTSETPVCTPPMIAITNLLATLEEAGEWAQVHVLDFVSSCVNPTPQEARDIVVRIRTRLKQANPSVTMAAIRCCLKMVQIVNDSSYSKEVFASILPPMIGLLNSGKEIAFTVLKSIHVILQKYRRLLVGNVNVFWCQFDEPLYVKLAKLDILLTLASEENMPILLEELKKYSAEEDVEFATRSIMAIGKIALSFESVAKACVDILVKLIQSKIQFKVQECIVVLANIFRRYPNQYESIISIMCQCFVDGIDDHRAKAAMAWVLGQYSENITNAGDLLDQLFLDSFLDEPTDVQLAIMTAIVKVYLTNPDDGKELVIKVLSLATTELDNPDVSDRAYMYLCLLTECPNRAVTVISTDPVPVTLKTDLNAQDLEPRLVEALFPLMGTLSVLYSMFPQEFVPSSKGAPILLDLPLGTESDSDSDSEWSEEEEEEEEEAETESETESSTSSTGLVLLARRSPATFDADIYGGFKYEDGLRVFLLEISNHSEYPLMITQAVINRNLFMMALEIPKNPYVIEPQQTERIIIRVLPSERAKTDLQPEPEMAVALKVNRTAPIYFTAPFQIDFILVNAEEGGRMSRAEFMEHIQSVPPEGIQCMRFEESVIVNITAAQSMLEASRIYFLARKGEAEGFFTARTVTGHGIALAFVMDGPILEVTLRVREVTLLPILMRLIRGLVM